MLLIETLFIVQIFIFVFFPTMKEQNKLVEGINNCESEIKFEKVLIKNDSEWDAALQEVYDIIKGRSDCKFGVTDFEKISSSYSKSRQTLTIKPKFKQDISILNVKKAKTDGYAKELKKVVESWPKNLSDIQKIEKINDYIIGKSDYYYEMLNSAQGDNMTTKNGFYYYSWQAIMDEGKGVCEAYAGLFNRMCELCGIECETVSNADHAWNRAKVNGEWKYFDVTWNDTTNKHRKYFNLTQAQMAADGEH